MSLDVYLSVPGERVTRRGSGIFIRENGATKEITREEWDERNPGHEPAIAPIAPGASEEVFWRNITHNLGRMASEAGIYKHLWRPEEIGITKAAQLIGPLSAGLELLRSSPERFKVLNPANGWGDYDGLVDFVDAYLAACKAHPDADVSVSR